MKTSCSDPPRCPRRYKRDVLTSWPPGRPGWTVEDALRTWLCPHLLASHTGERPDSETARIRAKLEDLGTRQKLAKIDQLIVNISGYKQYFWDLSKGRSKSFCSRSCRKNQVLSVHENPPSCHHRCQPSSSQAARISGEYGAEFCGPCISPYWAPGRPNLVCDREVIYQ